VFPPGDLRLTTTSTSLCYGLPKATSRGSNDEMSAAITRGTSRNETVNDEMQSASANCMIRRTDIISRPKLFWHGCRGRNARQGIIIIIINIIIIITASESFMTYCELVTYYNLHYIYTETTYIDHSQSITQDWLHGSINVNVDW